VSCVHLNFQADVSVGRLTDGEGGPVTSYMCSVRVHCAECGRPFEFVGLPLGLNLRGATSNMDASEANLAIKPSERKCDA